jgi:hypothetical protein
MDEFEVFQINQCIRKDRNKKTLPPHVNKLILLYVRQTKLLDVLYQVYCLTVLLKNHRHGWCVRQSNCCFYLSLNIIDVRTYLNRVLYAYMRAWMFVYLQKDHLNVVFFHHDKSFTHQYFEVADDCFEITIIMRHVYEKRYLMTVNGRLEDISRYHICLMFNDVLDAIKKDVQKY